MAVNGYAAAQDVADLKVSTAALAVVMGNRVNLVESVLGPVSEAVDALPGNFEEVSNSLATKVTSSENGADFDDASQVRTNIGADLSSNVLFTPAGSGVVARSVQSTLRDLGPTLYDYDGANASYRLQGAFDDNVSSLLIPDMPTVNEEVTSPGNIRLYGPGGFDLTGGGKLSLGGNSFIVPIPDIAEDVPLFSTVIKFVAPHTLTVNRVFGWWNSTPFSGSPYKEQYHDSGKFRVAEIVDGQDLTSEGLGVITYGVRIYGVVQTPIVAADVDVYQYLGGSVHLDGLTILPPPTGRSIDIVGCVGITVENLRIPAGTDVTAILIDAFYDAAIRNNDITTLSGDAYPFIIGGGRWATVTDTRGQRGRRHVIGLGVEDRPGSGMLEDFHCSGLMAENIIKNGVGSTEMHGNVRRATYDGCEHSGANIAGYDATYRNGSTTGIPAANQAAGTGFYGSEIGGGRFLIENYLITVNGTGAEQGSHIHLKCAKRNEKLDIVLRNNTYRNVAADPSATLMIVVEVAPDGELLDPEDISITIDGGEYIGGAPPFAMLNIKGTEDVSAICQINYTNPISGIGRIYSASLSANYAIPFTGPGLKRGLARWGDEDVNLVRATAVESHRFDVAGLTVERFFYLPDPAHCAPGDKINISRYSGGAGSLRIRAFGSGSNLFTLGGSGGWVELEYRGNAAQGTFQVMRQGPI